MTRCAECLGLVDIAKKRRDFLPLHTGMCASCRKALGPERPGFVETPGDPVPATVSSLAVEAYETRRQSAAIGYAVDMLADALAHEDWARVQTATLALRVIQVGLAAHATALYEKATA